MKSVQHTTIWLNDVLCCRAGPHNLESGEGTIAPKKQLKAAGVDLVGGDNLVIIPILNKINNFYY
jgi:hypothetical protein